MCPWVAQQQQLIERAFFARMDTADSDAAGRYDRMSEVMDPYVHLVPAGFRYVEVCSASKYVHMSKYT